MTLLAALLVAFAAYVGVASLTGHAPRLRRRPQVPAAVSARQQWLIQAGTDLTPLQFRVGSVGAGLVTFVVCAALTGIPVVAAVPAIVVAFLPQSYFARQRRTRMRELQRAWPEGLRELNASLEIGMSVHQALCGMAASGPEPLRRAFARYPLLARMQGPETALEIIKEELADPASDRAIEVLLLAQQRGERTITDVLEDLAVATTLDIRTNERIDTLALESKINARAVFVLPWLMLVLITAAVPEFKTFYTSPLGVLVIVAGGVASLTGMWLVARFSRDEVEERVFVAAPGQPEGERR